MPEVTISLYVIAFWLAIFFTVIGAVLGLMGIWIKEFWKSETTIKLLLTDLIFAGTAAIVAVLTKLLGS